MLSLIENIILSQFQLEGLGYGNVKFNRKYIMPIPIRRVGLLKVMVGTYLMNNS